MSHFSDSEKRFLQALTDAMGKMMADMTKLHNDVAALTAAVEAATAKIDQLKQELAAAQAAAVDQATVDSVSASVEAATAKLSGATG